MSCNTCNKPVTVCCCPKPAVVPTPAPSAPLCINPIVDLLTDALDCYKDAPCQNQNCKSPVIDWLTDAISYAPQNPVTAPEIWQEFFNIILANGVVLSNTTYCCSQCCDDSAYILVSTEETALSDFIDIAGAPKCCANFYGNVEAQSTLIETYDNYNVYPYPVKCDNNFDTCIAYLGANTENMPALIGSGIYETVGSLANSEICGLVDVMLSAGFTPALIQSTFERILAIGLVVACSNGQVFVGGVNAFGDWYKTAQVRPHEGK